MHLVIDAHEDLAWNMATFKRDYALSAYVTREIEMESIAPKVNGDTMLGWPEYIEGAVGIVFGTLFAGPAQQKKHPWDTQSYSSPGEANRLYHAQLDIYHQFEEIHPDKFALIKTKHDLAELLTGWEPVIREEKPSTKPKVGIVILMEGAQCIQKPDELYDWWDQGVRMIGLAWHSNQYCGGTGEPGPLSPAGRRLLSVMAEIGFVLDISHMDVLSARLSLDIYEGTIIASHANASALIRAYQGNRHLSDDIIHQLISRNGIMGIIPFNYFLDRDWQPSSGRETISLQMVADQIDHVCQLAGNARHVGIGTDFDGGFGLQSTPFELCSIADIQKLSAFLENMHYSQDDIARIMGLNWQHMLEYNLP